VAALTEASAAMSRRSCKSKEKKGYKNKKQRYETAIAKQPAFFVVQDEHRERGRRERCAPEKNDFLSS
jgi:hypothetical protein